MHPSVASGPHHPNTEQGRGQAHPKEGGLLLALGSCREEGEPRAPGAAGSAAAALRAPWRGVGGCREGVWVGVCQ